MSDFDFWFLRCQECGRPKFIDPKNSLKKELEGDGWIAVSMNVGDGTLTMAVLCHLCKPKEQ